ncbi:MAG: DNA cytosine methyltransferase [Kofleriaceae bacterium]|nr:DNA cytosine methyltransferase [Kofleriaceae bacterium]MBP9169812.1 DNA cytosine methyltransferase [Kofleriaceae bacterium]MBP9858097.1 DNA cytosine methyltransferase [Kofleriaceae bacterium]
MGKPKVISLYTGAGGLDYGFEAAGFSTAVAVEMNHDSCETLRANRRWPVIERDILRVSSHEILRTAGLRKGEAAVLIGGPPCQPFSKAGYWSKGDSGRLDDPRAATLGAYLRVLEDTTPAAFLLENVEGLAYRGKDEGLRLLLDAIEGVNKRTKSKYRPTMQVVMAADYGVPQLRKRFIMIAARDGTEFTFPKPTHAAPQLEQTSLFDRLPPYRTAWDALADVGPDEGEDVAVRGRWAELLPSIPEGHNYLWHTDRMGGMPLFGWRRRYWSFLLKLAKSQPSWTVQAQPGPAVGPFHWDNRRLAMRELARIQTFPDDVRVTGSRTEIQRQIGNAVPSLLAEVLAREISVQLLGNRRPKAPPRLLPTDRSPVPAATATAAVPLRFHHLAGEHTAHPGTGRGHGASKRTTPLAIAS